MFGNQPTDAQLSGSSLADGRQAILFLYPPRVFSTQMKRPTMYNFGQRFTNDATEAITQAHATGSNAPIARFLNDTRNFEAVIPTADGIPIDLSQMSSCWTFVLMVDNDNGGLNSIGLSSALANNRMIYIGYCTEEPMNPVSHMGRQTVNENAYLIMTHKTQINRLSTFGSQSFIEQIQTHGDVDVIDPQAVHHLMGGGDQYLLRPQDMDDYSSMSDTGYVFSSTGEISGLNMKTEHQAIPTDLHLPRNNLETILNAVKEGIDQADVRANSGTLYSPYDLTHEYVNSNTQRNLQRNDPIRIGLKEGQPIRMGDILQTYQPKVQPLGGQQMIYGVNDQVARSNRNVFSSFLMSTIPVIMANCTILEFIFSYDSYSDQFEVIQYRSYLQASQEVVREKLRAVMSNIKFTVFPVLLMKNHFTLNGHFTTADISRCLLNFQDEPVITEMYEVPHILGGFNSPLIGDAKIATNNSINFVGLLGTLTDRGHEDYASGLQHEVDMQESYESTRDRPARWIDPTKM